MATHITTLLATKLAEEVNTQHRRTGADITSTEFPICDDLVALCATYLKKDDGYSELKGDIFRIFVRLINKIRKSEEYRTLYPELSI